MVALLAKAEPSHDGLIRGRRHIMNDDSDINATRHARALVGGVAAAAIGRTDLFVSGGAEHQGPDGGGPVAIIARVRDLRTCPTSISPSAAAPSSPPPTRLRADVGIRGGRIVALGERIADAARTIDASGLLVLPGGIDSHVHIAQASGPGIVMADDFASATRAAAAGGNTCVMPFALQPRGASLRDGDRTPTGRWRKGSATSTWPSTSSSRTRRRRCSARNCRR